jgi:hypothetical protein
MSYDTIEQAMKEPEWKPFIAWMQSIGVATYKGLDSTILWTMENKWLFKAFKAGVQEGARMGNYYKPQ